MFFPWLFLKVGPASGPQPSRTSQVHSQIFLPPRTIVDSSDEIQAGAARFYGINSKNPGASIPCEITVNATNPVDIQVVQSHDDFEAYMQGSEYEGYSDCQAIKVFSYDKKIALKSGSGVVVRNRGVGGTGLGGPVQATVKIVGYPDGFRL